MRSPERAGDRSDYFLARGRNDDHIPAAQLVIGDEFGSPATLSFPRNARLGLSLEW